MKISTYITDNPKFVAFLYLFVRMLHLSLKFRLSAGKCLETRRYLGSGRKTVNTQGYSELREPIKIRENCYSPIW